jgi:hypothetical protein
MLENQLELPEEDDTIATQPIHGAFGQHPAGDHACLPSGRTTLHMLQTVRPSYDHPAHTSSSLKHPIQPSA